MKIGRVFCSGCAVYVIVAACSAMDPGRGTGGGAGHVEPASSGASGGSTIAGGGTEPGTGGRGGAGDVAGAGGRGGFGGIMDPVPPANADPMSGARLKAKTWRGADGSVQYVYTEWYDSLLDTDCTPSLPWGGSIRCVPARMHSINVSGIFYSDSTCTQLITNAPPCYASQAYVHQPLGSGGDCIDEMHVYPILSTIEMPSFYRLNDGICDEVVPPSPRPMAILGDDVDPSAFVEMSLVVEP